MNAPVPRALASQLDALTALLDGDQPLLTEDQRRTGTTLKEQTEFRLHRSMAHTTVGLFGATGSGKSSLFNRIAGADVAPTGVIRPTTFKVSAALWHEAGASELLDWLAVDEVYVAGSEPALILLDLPDFDSVALENRAVVDRLVGQVDVLVWVVERQKYADRVIHQDYIRPLSHRASVTLAVLNQIDLLSPDGRKTVLQGLRQTLADDGLDKVEVFPVSAFTEEGVPALRKKIMAIAQRRQAIGQHLSADIAQWAGQVLDEAGLAGGAPLSSGPSAAQIADFRRAVCEAVGVAAWGKNVAEVYRKWSAQSTGWMPLSWLCRRFPRLCGHRVVTETAPNTSTVSLPSPTAEGRAALQIAVRRFAAQVSEGIPSGWRDAAPGGDDLANGLAGALADTAYPLSTSWWWRLGKFLQQLALLVALVGVGWYLVAWVTQALHLPEVPITKIEGWPVPLLLFLAGALAGPVLGGGFRIFGALGAWWHRLGAESAARKHVDAAIKAQVVAPLQASVEQVNQLRKALQKAQRQ